MSKEVIYKELIAFHPGSYIEDIVEELNITQSEFAERLGVSAKTISKIINGEDRVSNDVANRLAKITGISLKTWLNLQNNYDIKLMEIEDAQDEDEKCICDWIDFSYFKKNNFVEDKRYSIKEKISELRKLLNISTLSMLLPFNTSVSYRNTREFTDKSIVNSNIMLELAINSARNKTNNKYDKRKLEKVLPTIREMTLLDPEIFYPKLTEMLLECGIVLVGLPNLKNANLQGATKRFRNGSVLLLITDRNKRSDIFWFSLIHEIAHIYYNEFYSNQEDHEDYERKEDRADKFAENFLIPADKYNDFLIDKDLGREAVLKFAEEIEIHPSIVVGRLQSDEHIGYSQLNDLKINYEFKFSD